ncbi:hypothetical protein TNIN_50641 [Trichonephila inaurata madagascariensis]|uniref:Uncharacterized protein n=1 Tax=Trichonephila inaurata madagascariensis TaxID=2747483 RepID=A0A8X6YSE5_9ARAC|nr:hypothetical protein TNIN_50641 [Trichonephila inaurata madagascariensis]
MLARSWCGVIVFRRTSGLKRICFRNWKCVYVDDNERSEETKHFTLKDIEKCWGTEKQIESYFLANNSLPEREREEFLKTNLQNCLSAYQEIYKEWKSKIKQSLMTDILKPKPTGSAMEFVDETSSNHVIRPVKRSLASIICED